MTIQHETITDPKIHEPKGATTAAINTGYFSNGAGSGTWQLVKDVNLDATTVKTFISNGLADASIVLPHEFWIFGLIPDISTASSVILSIPTSCHVTDAYLTLYGAIITANSTVNYKNAAGTVCGSATVAFAGSGKGTQFHTDLTLIGGNPHFLTGPTWFEIQNAAGSTNVVPAHVAIKATRAN
jgi:hypothetical protein